MTEEDKKLKVLVFVPISTCGCSYTRFMDRIFAEFIPYSEKIDVEVKDIQGEEAQSYRLFNNSVVILDPPNRDKPLIFSSFLELRRFLEANFPKKELSVK
ncbi:MAG: hypothetical protein JW776_08340 [Candidatus Lokiarchaeota archaeon]|nr:hypothetical protein [Candidatus Lokiarchaeota archaeon]